jgi:Endoplasmic reticulum vesicle transporter
MEAIADYGGDRTVQAIHAWTQEHTHATAAAARGGEPTGVRLTGLHGSQWPGCVIAGSLWVNRVPGNFHIEARSEAHDYNSLNANLSHVVNSFRVGETPSPYMARKLKNVSVQRVVAVARCMQLLRWASAAMLRGC